MIVSKLTMSRRTFGKVVLATAAAVSAGFAATSNGFRPSYADEFAGGDVHRLRSGCRGCGKCECGVWVTVANGRVVKIEGDPSAKQSAGNCCTKSQASMQAAYHPDRLHYPMKRTTPKGDHPGWSRISWDEAWNIFAPKVKELQEKYGKETVMNMNGTSRIWANTGPGIQYITGTPNNFSAGQICKGPRMFVGTTLDFFGSFWLAHTDEVDHHVYVQWGTSCEYSNYDDSCRTVTRVAKESDCHILIDPRVSPMGKSADYWLPVRPGSDGAIAMAWGRIIVKNELYDDLFVKRWTNAPFLVCRDIEPSGYYIVEGRSASTIKTCLLKESDLVEGGSPKKFIAFDELNDRFTYFDVETYRWEGETFTIPETGREIAGGWLPDASEFNPAKDPAIYGEFEVTLKDGRTSKVKPVWEYLCERFEPYTPEKAAEITGVDAKSIEDTCKVWATRIDPSLPNGGLHFQLATDQCGNCSQTIRTLLTIQEICGCMDMPCCGRGPTAGLVSPSATPLYPLGPARIVDQFIENAKMCAGDKFPMLRWYDECADTASMWDAMLTDQPYPMRCTIAATGNFMSMANSHVAWNALASEDFFFMADLWHVPMAGMADVLVPTAHWLETDFPRLSQGPSGGQGATVRCTKPPAEAISEMEMQRDMAKSMGVPWCMRGPDLWPSYDDCMDQYAIGHMGYTWEQYKDEFQKNGWWEVKKIAPQRWGTYRRHEIGVNHWPQGFAVRPILFDAPGFHTATGMVEIWSTLIETYVGKEEYYLPSYVEPWKSPVSTPELFEPKGVFEVNGEKAMIFNLTTGSRNPSFFHSEHRQLPWCRELWPTPRVELNPEDAADLGIEQGDWVWIENEKGRVRETADLYYGIGRGVANANHTWWYPELSEPKKGFDLSNINCIVWEHDQDPLYGATAIRAYPVRIYKATAANSPFGNPCPCDDDGTEIISTATDPRLKEWFDNLETNLEERRVY